MQLGIVAPLPPIPAGGAEYVAALLPYLARHVQISCFVDDVDAVDPELRKQFRVRPLEERHDPTIDMLVYHIGNNPHHSFVFDAAMEGPAGIIEVHDGSMHHYLQESTLGQAKNPFAYAQLGEEAHGYAGRRLAEMRMSRFRGTIELFLYDYLAPMLDRARGIIVHSDYANHLVQLRSPRVHSWVVPHFAPDFPAPEKDRKWTGVSEDTLLVANLGFITRPKRPLINLLALRNVLDRGLKAHMAFVGRDDMHGELQADVKRLGLEDHVTITGYVGTDELRRWAQAVDVIVNLRAPHVGESSGALSYGLAAGKPVIVQPVGSWADFPDDVVVRIPVTDDDTVPLASAIFALGQDKRLGARFGDAARRYAREELDADKCAQDIVRAASLALESEWVPPAWFSATRTIGARTFLHSGRARLEMLLSEESVADGREALEALQSISPARPHGRLLAVDVPPRMVQVLENLWGYEVDLRTLGKARTQFITPISGVAGSELSWKPFTWDEVQRDSYDVIVTSGIAVDRNAGVRINQALTPQGSFIDLDTARETDALLSLGLSSHIHQDHPVTAPDPSAQPTLITVVTKAATSYVPAGAE